MSLQLRPYQEMLVDFIVEHPRCKLFVPMGLGKTVSVLTSLDRLSLVEDVFPVLVLAPLRVARSTWPAEISKWPHLRHLRMLAVVGSESERRMALRHDADIYTCNYENLPWLVEHYGERWPFKTVVADECTKLKGFRLRQGTRRAKALGRVAHGRVKRYIGLTGTPAPNGLHDLWGQAWFLDAGVRLGRTYEAFKQRWFRPSDDGYGVVPLPHAQAEIQDKLRDSCITLAAGDWFDLREPIINNVYVELPLRARKLYLDMEKEMFMQLDEHAVEAFNAAARTVKCLQVANGAAYVGQGSTEWKEIHEAKLEALEDIIEEAAGAPVMVAYHFKSDLARLRKHFPQGRPLDTTPQTIADWNEGRIPVLFAHPASTGHGLNLQDGGNILVFFGHDWNLENRLQIIERIGPTRQKQAGHDRPVFIHNIIARDTVDEMVLERVNTKREVQDILLDAMKRRRLR